MEVIAKLIESNGILIVIAAIFLWQYIEDKKERRAERKSQSEQHDRLIEVVANNNTVVKQNSLALERAREVNEDIEDKLALIEKGVSELHGLVKEHNNQTDEIYRQLMKEINQLKKVSDNTKQEVVKC